MGVGKKVILYDKSHVCTNNSLNMESSETLSNAQVENSDSCWYEGPASVFLLAEWMLKSVVYVIESSVKFMGFVLLA